MRQNYPYKPKWPRILVMFKKCNVIFNDKIIILALKKKMLRNDFMEKYDYVLSNTLLQMLLQRLETDKIYVYLNICIN